MTAKKPVSEFDKIFSSDKGLETGGVVMLIRGDRGKPDEMSVTLASTGGHNFEYAEAVQRLSQPYQILIDQGKLDAEKMREILYQVYADTIVKTWAGITLDGKPTDCTPENVFAVFRERPAFFNACRTFAGQTSNYQEHYVRAAVGK